MKFQIESPPQELDDKTRTYLRRQFEAVDVAMAKDPMLKAADKYVPSVQKEGTLVYFNAAIPLTPISSAGLYFVDGTGFHRIMPFDLASSGAAPVSHTHSIAQVTGLQTDLDAITGRLDAIETAIVGINVRLDTIESKLP